MLLNVITAITTDQMVLSTIESDEFTPDRQYTISFYPKPSSVRDSGNWNSGLRRPGRPDESDSNHREGYT
jgi:hypothetical protein